MPWDGQIGVDIVPVVAPGGCPEAQDLIQLGLVTLDYEVCVTAIIDVAGSADVDFNPIVTDFCIGQELQLHEGAADNVSWDWEGPNFNATGNDPTYTITDATDFGDYTVTVTDLNGCTASQTIQIDQLPSPGANASAVDNMICVGDQISLNEDIGDGSTYQWTGPNGFSQAGQNATINTSGAANIGTYTVIVTDGNGCTNSSDVEIFQAADVDIDVSAVALEVCPGQDIMLQEDGSNGASWTWTGPDGFSSILEDPVVPNSTTNNLGAYNVTVTAPGFCDSEGSVTIDAAAPPIINLDVNQNICVGQDILLNGTSGGGNTTWNWEGPNSFSSNDQNPIISPSVGADFGTYFATVTDDNLCSNTTSIIVDAMPGPEICISGSGDFCEGLCDGSNPSLSISINPTGANLDVELSFPGSGISDVLLAGLSNGDNILICSDPSLTNPNFNGSELLLPTSGLSNNEIIDFEIFNVIDPLGCIAVSNPTCTASFTYLEAAPVDIIYNGSILTDGDQIVCETNFDPTVDPNIGGTWLINGIPLSPQPPIDLSTFGQQFVSLEFEPFSDECAAITAVDIELVPCACVITDSFLDNIICDGNGTPTDSDDDFISFTLDPQAINGGTGYMVQVSQGSVSPITGTYGLQSLFSLELGSAGSGDVQLTITDADNSSCFLQVNLSDTGSCSNDPDPCSISDVIVTNIMCDENGTPTNPDDDFVTFDIEVQGTGLVGDYTVSNPIIFAVDQQGTFGQISSFQTDPGVAGDGAFPMFLTSINDPTCETIFTVIDPGSCSGTCIISAPQLSAVECNNAGTPSDPNDDFLFFDMQVFGQNIASGYTVTAAGNTITPNTGNYLVAEPFQFQGGSAGSGNIAITIVDDADPNCQFEVIVQDVGSCSEACNISSAEPISVMCNDNNTPNDMTDDFLTFELDPQGVNLVGDYTLQGSEVPAAPDNQGAFGVSTSFSTIPGSAGNGPIALNIFSNIDPSCAQGIIVVDPGTCSNGCPDPGDCDDDDCSNGVEFWDGGICDCVSTDPPDPSTCVDDGDCTNGIEEWDEETCSCIGAPVIFGCTEVTADNYNPIATCDDGSCEFACTIGNVMLDNVLCQDNGTESDDTDDIISFSLFPQIANGSTGYEVTTSSGNITPTSGSYAGVQVFVLDPGTAGAGDITITITDQGNNNCMATVTIEDTGSCSSGCPDPGDCDNDNCADGTEVWDGNNCECISIDIPDPTTCIDDGDCNNGEEMWDDTTCECVAVNIPDESSCIDDGDCLNGTETWNDESCECELIVETFGCTNPSANNFDENATCDDGSCEFDCPDPGDCDNGNCADGTEVWDGINCECISIDIPDPTTCIDDGDCNNGEEMWDDTTCECIAVNIPDELTCVDDGDCLNGTETWNDQSCECDQIMETLGCTNPSANNYDENATCDDGSCEFNCPDPGDCDNGDCTDGTEVWDGVACECTSIDVPDPSTCVDDGDCTNGIEEWNETSCECDLSLPVVGCTNPSANNYDPNAECDDGSCEFDCPDPGDCDDGDCSNGVEIWDGVTCDCVATNIPDPDSCVDDGDCSNGDEFWNSTSCECEVINLIDPSSCVDDGDCTNGQEVWDEITCECISTGEPDCDVEETVEISCDDDNELTEDDIEIVLACDNSIVCVPCEGSLNTPSYFIPNVFTPDGDLDNDEFGVYSGIEFTIEEFSIYDRWGNKIFTRTNILNTDPDHMWDGTFDGQAVIPGVYIYYIKLGEPFDDETEVGDLTVY